jgi:hypothetical protein
MVIGVCFIALGQMVVVGPFHFYATRILILSALARIVIRKEYVKFTFHRLDKTIIKYVLVCFIAYCIVWGNIEGFINRLGFAFNILGLYFIFRCMIDGMEHIISIYLALAISTIPLSALFIVEATTGRNWFSIFGGVPEITLIREGKLRCQGPFAHPILAGTFAATLGPILFSQALKANKHRLIYAIGFIASNAILIASNSSGPLLATGFAIIGFILWPLRNHMKWVRISLFTSVVLLHLIMKAPVWSLIGRISNVIGGTGYHRVELIDAAIAHLNEWWLVGTKFTYHWLEDPLPDDPNNVDITNQYIFVGISGGLLTLYYFIKTIVQCYSALGISRLRLDIANSAHRYFVWALGVSMATHIASFISVVYFDQMVVYFYLLIASCVAIDIELDRINS